MTRSLRVLMLTQSYAPIVGGIEHMVEDMSSQLVKRGHEVSVATLRQPKGEPVGSEEIPVYTLGSAVHDIPGLSLDTERHHAPPAPDPRTTLELRRLIGRLRPDVVNAHDWLVHSYLPLNRRASAGLVLSMHDYGLICATKRYMYEGSVCSGPGNVKCVRCSREEYESTVKGTIAAVGTRASGHRMRRHVDVFMPVSNAVRELCRLGAEDTVRVIPNFVSGMPEPLAGDPELDRLGDEPFILYFGDVSVQKGVDNLLAAYGQLASPPPLVLIGRRFEGQIEDTGGAVALGPMPHRFALEAVRRSMFTVAPSIWPDPFPVVALETAAAGKPIVASRIGGLQDSVADGETGILVPPGDRTALAAALERLAGDEGLRERMGAAAAARQATLFTPDTVVPQYEEAYELAIERRQARRARR